MTVKENVFGSCIVTEYFDDNGMVHRDDGPAIIHQATDGAYRIEIWMRHGVHHRSDGPAWIRTWTPERGLPPEHSYYLDGNPYTGVRFVDITEEIR